MIVVMCFLYKWRVLRKIETHDSLWTFLIIYAEYRKFKCLINNSYTRLYYLKVLSSLIVIFVVRIFRNYSILCAYDHVIIIFDISTVNYIGYQYVLNYLRRTQNMLLRKCIVVKETSTILSSLYNVCVTITDKQRLL